MQRRYITVDVFTDRAFGGNPLGVVLDALGEACSDAVSLGEVEVRGYERPMAVWQLG